jgi:CheY-like chemotaxis protein
LIVDDSEICREVTRVMLESCGYQVVAIDNQFTLGQVLGKEKPDLVLIDVGMPAIRGDQLVEVAKRYRLHKCPLVLFSDRSENELAQLARACGAHGFICKTPDTAVLHKLVKRYLGAQP